MAGNGWRASATAVAIGVVAGITVVVGGAPAASAAPTFCSVESTSGSNSGPATLVARSLLGMTPDAQLVLQRDVEGGPIEASGETIVGGTEIRGTVDLTAHAPGGWFVVIRNPDGSTCTAGQYTVTAAGTPTIASVSPATVAPGATGVVLTLTGANLFRGAGVVIDDEDPTRTDIAVVADSFGPAADGTQHRTTIDVPALGAVRFGAHDVVLTNADGASVRCDGCLRVALPAPTVTSIAPTVLERSVPMVVTVNGSGFVAGTTVSFGDDVEAGAVQSLTPTSFRVEVSPSAAAVLGRRSVTVTNPDAQTATCSSCATVIANHGNWLRAAYRDILGRAPEPAGAEFWREAIRNGVSRTQVASSVMNSAEFRGLVVDDFFRALLGRDPDPAGRRYWADRLLRSTFVDLEAALLASAEFAARVSGGNGPWVETVFVVATGQFPDAATRQFWVNELGRGRSRQSAATTILRSVEARRFVVSTYFQQYLRRGVDPAGQDFWVGQLRAGLREEQFIAALIASGEYFIRAG